MRKDTLSEAPSDHTDALEPIRQTLLQAALPNAPFDGWSDQALANAAVEAEIDPYEARLAFPRGGRDLALYFHREGDRMMRARLAEADLGALRYSEKVAEAVWIRLDIASEHREAARRAAAMFALPIYAADGARAIWGTADHIWTALGDSSDDLNWYSKRAILSGVISSSLLYWLGDESQGFERSRAFLDRRIADVMRFEKFKASMNATPLGRLAMAGPNWLASRIRRPARDAQTGAGGLDLPGGP